MAYWTYWDLKMCSLARLISFHRLDLLSFITRCPQRACGLQTVCGLPVFIIITPIYRQFFRDARCVEFASSFHFDTGEGVTWPLWNRSRSFAGVKPSVLCDWCIRSFTFPFWSAYLFFCIPVFFSWFSIRISVSFTFGVSDSNVISLCLSGVSEMDNWYLFWWIIHLWLWK